MQHRVEQRPQCCRAVGLRSFGDDPRYPLQENAHRASSKSALQPLFKRHDLAIEPPFEVLRLTVKVLTRH